MRLLSMKSRITVVFQTLFLTVDQDIILPSSSNVRHDANVAFFAEKIVST